MQPRFHISYFQAVNRESPRMSETEYKPKKALPRKTQITFHGRFGESHWWSDRLNQREAQHALD
jgi:hypothetical protein